jgi:LytR cell envelope-related transcriptional attenuator
MLSALHVSQARDVRRLRERAGWAPSRRVRPIGTRSVAVALVGLLVLGGAAAYGVTQLIGDDGADRSGKARATTKPKRKRPAVKPGNVTVAVLNGTTVPGLAATLSDEVDAAGFKVGTITNFSDQQLAESVVQYVRGHEAEARAVSRRLGIDQREPVSPTSQALAGDATVVVIAGADKAP